MSQTCTACGGWQGVSCKCFDGLGTSAPNGSAYMLAQETIERLTADLARVTGERDRYASKSKCFDDFMGSMVEFLNVSIESSKSTPLEKQLTEALLNVVSDRRRLREENERLTTPDSRA